jgi:hypothetical protein
MSNSFSEMMAAFNKAEKQPVMDTTAIKNSIAPFTVPLSELATALVPVEARADTYSENLDKLNELDSNDSSPISMANIFATKVSQSSPTPFSKDQFAPEPTAVMAFPQPNAAMTAAELTTYHLNHLRHVVSSATASREVLAELWRHLKANPETKDQLLPLDINSITVALAKVTGARTNVMKVSKAKANVKATAKSESAAIVDSIFDTIDFKL